MMEIRLAQASDAPNISRLISQLTRFFTVDPKGVGADSLPTIKLLTFPAVSG
jgi:hypothetical protein